jgi:hypothetical protein
MMDWFPMPRSGADSATHKALAQQGTGGFQPAFQCCLRQPQQIGSLVLCVPLEVAQHQRHAVMLGKPCQLFVEDLRNLAPAGRLRNHNGRRCGARLVLAPNRESSSRLHGSPAGDAVQKASQRRHGAKATGAPDEDKEGSLKGILGVGRVGQ